MKLYLRILRLWVIIVIINFCNCQDNFDHLRQVHFPSGWRGVPLVGQDAELSRSQQESQIRSYQREGWIGRSYATGQPVNPNSDERNPNEMTPRTRTLWNRIINNNNLFDDQRLQSYEAVPQRDTKGYPQPQQLTARPYPTQPPPPPPQRNTKGYPQPQPLIRQPSPTVITKAFQQSQALWRPPPTLPPPPPPQRNTKGYPQPQELRRPPPMLAPPPPPQRNTKGYPQPQELRRAPLTTPPPPPPQRNTKGYPQPQELRRPPPTLPPPPPPQRNTKGYPQPQALVRQPPPPPQRNTKGYPIQETNNNFESYNQQENLRNDELSYGYNNSPDVELLRNYYVTRMLHEDQLQDVYNPRQRSYYEGERYTRGSEIPMEVLSGSAMNNNGQSDPRSIGFTLYQDLQNPRRRN